MKNFVTAAASVVLVLSAANTAPAEPISFKDHRGVEITLESPPRKVATIVRSGPILFRAVGGTADNIASVNPSFFKRDYVAGLYGELLPELGQLPPTAAIEGFVPNIEALLEIGPDVVVQWMSEDFEPLERVGLKTVGWDCCTEQNRRDYITSTGYMTGRSEHARTILALQDASAETMKARFADMDAEDRVTALYIDQFADQIRIIANGSQDLSLSGVTNAAADGTGQWWKTIDLEQLFAWNPNVILIPAYVQDLSPQTFYDNTLLQGLEAVKNKRVYKIPAFAGSPDAPEIYLSSPWLAAVAHGATAAPDVRSDVRSAYKAIYGIDASEHQLDDVLWMEQNQASAGYSDTFN